MQFFPFWDLLDYNNPEESLQPAGCIHTDLKKKKKGAKISSIVGKIM